MAMYWWDSTISCTDAYGEFFLIGCNSAEKEDMVV